ncbi:hypothetical protein E2562_019752 [Oryza meyeriana var. granulata]|uniref:Mixed lineage kinase domain-containing protein n=1 Tax=Oryza meyeriana var. granulata TaxID=110450 RepID=A0A6G1C8C3_9ORYZ|nr:hypothetical protein E2562_019752 [Oryza meyeriana var. granulata]KAF0896282.1 hypothetical protein E2562_019752 [Oryza meyeriana var. granulata]
MAELVGYASSARGLIKMIMATVQTAKRNKKQCRELEDRVRMVSGVLNRHELQPSPETMARAREALAGLHAVLREAHELAVSFQSGGGKRMRRLLWVRRVCNARREAEKLADVLGKIDFYISLYPAIAHEDMAHRLDRLLWTTTMSVIVSAVAFAGFFVVSISMVSRKK